MVIRSNIAGSNILRNWQNHGKRISTAVERLSSGLKLNRASDDPSGLCMSEQMKMKIRMLQGDQANVTSYISKANLDESRYAETQAMLQRMYELSAKASSGTISDEDREALDAEFQQMLSEIDRINPSSELPLCKRMASLPDAETYGKGDPDAVSISGNNLVAYLDALDDYLSKISSAAQNGDQKALAALGLDTSSGLSNKDLLHNAVTEFTKRNGKSLLQSEGGSTGSTYTLWISGGSITVKAEAANSGSLGLNGSNLRDQKSAQSAMDAVKKAIDRVSVQRGEQGALQNRLERTMDSLARMEENLSLGLSHITDADMAKEMMVLAKEKILSQASAFLMAHTNQQPKEVVALLQSLLP